jgi:hypothetical protein
MTAHSGLRTVTIGYDTKAQEEAFLKSLASRNCSGEPFFYTADVQTSSITKSLQDVFNQITKEIKKEVKGDSLIDTIPAEFSMVEGTIQTNDTSLQGVLSEDKKTINWSWNKTVIQKKVFEMSFITVLDISKVPASYTKVNTNGTTIDPSVAAEGSLTFAYLDTKDVSQKISLVSPKLSLNRKTEEIMREVCDLYDLDFELFKDLGSWEKEYTNVKGKFLGAKRYIITDESGKTKTTIAGLPKKSLMTYCEQHNKDPYEVFTNKMLMNIEVSFKNASCYNDVPHSDYINGVKMNELSSVGIFGIDFTMTLNDFYIQQILELKERYRTNESRIY